MTKILFETTSTPTQTTTIGNSNFKKYYPGVNKSMSWLEFVPYIEQGVEKYIIPSLGKTFYELIVDSFDEGQSLDKSIIDCVSTASAYFAIYMAMPFLNITIADGGISQKNSENNTATAVNQWRYHTARREALIQAFESLDQCHRILADNIDDVLISVFKASDQYKLSRTDLFDSTQTLNRHINIQDSRRSFVLMIPYLTEMQTELRDIFGSVFYSEFIDLVKDTDATLTDDQKELLNLSRSYVAYQALHNCAEIYNIHLTADGLTFESYTDGMKTNQKIDSSSIDRLKLECIRNYKRIKSKIHNLLASNTEDFQTFHDNINTFENQEKIIVPTNGVGGVGLF